VGDANDPGHARDGGWSGRVWAAETGLLLFGLAWLVFRFVLDGGEADWPYDYLIHIRFTNEIDARPLPAPHPLFHYTVWWITYLFVDSHTTESCVRVAPCAGVVLALAIGWRGWLTFREVFGGVRPAGAAAVTLLLAVVMALPKWWKWPQIYLGQVNPNVWHNPTAIFVAPLALLVFREGMRYLDRPRLETALSLGLWASACCLAKPNYVLAFYPCFGLPLVAAAWRSWRLGRDSAFDALGHVLVSCLPPVATLAWQFSKGFEGDHSVGFDPFAVWTYYVKWYLIPSAILAGVAFPAVVAALFPREAWRDRRTLFSWCVLAVSLAQFALLTELPKDRSPYGNFGWAMVAADYVLFVASCRLLFQQPRGWRVTLSLGVLVLHAASGAFCLAQTMANPTICQLF
jgi:hypothetical protein